MSGKDPSIDLLEAFVAQAQTGDPDGIVALHHALDRWKPSRRQAPSEAVGAMVRGIRRRLGLTQVEFAARMGATGPGAFQTVSSWERGTRRPGSAAWTLIGTMVQGLLLPRTERGGSR